MDQKKHEETFDLILKGLNNVTQDLKKINERLDRLEGKTDEIHSLVPFGQWFEGFSRGLARKISWFGGNSTPELIENDNEYIENDSEYNDNNKEIN